ncbi:MAG TPA: hypothetical protein VFA32_05575 [Dehalococcoidia bacterium]|nr:hypothetical protein [Dehalococcoidia bacterium]
MTEDRPDRPHIEVRPLTDEEAKRGLEALKELEGLGKRILARRKGKPLPSSSKLIRRAREDLSKRL